MKVLLPRWLIRLCAGISLILILGGVWIFARQQNRLRQDASDYLSAVAQLKSGQIARWKTEKLSDASAITENPFFLETIREYMSDLRKEDAQKLLVRFRLLQSHYGYFDVLLTGPEGRILLSLSGRSGSAVIGESAIYFAEALTLKHPVMTDILPALGKLPARVNVIAPFTVSSKSPVIPAGMIVLVSDVDRSLYPLVLSWPRKSRSAESYLVRRDGDNALYLNELRHRPDTAFREKIPIARNDVPAVMAVLGKEGVFEGVDYRGMRVLAAIQAVPSTPWFLVAKIDRAEALEAWHMPAVLVVSLVAALVLAVAAVVWGVWRQGVKTGFQFRQRDLSLLNAMGESARIGAWELDVASREGRWTDELYRIFDLPFGQKPSIEDSPQFFHPEDREIAAEANRLAIEHGKPFDLELRFITAKNRRIWVRNICRPEIADGKVKRLTGVFQDITERRLAEAILQIRVGLGVYAGDHSLQEVLQKTLDEVGELTESPIGFYHFVEPDQKHLTLQAWSTRTIREFCKAEGYGSRYSLDEAGVWVDCVREKKPVIHNNYASLPDKKGMPPGHARVVRELVVPILRSGRIVAILGVGNKPADYTEKDVDVVSFIADVAWDIAAHKRSEEELHESEERFRQFFTHIPDLCYLVSTEGEILFVNQSALRILGYSEKELVGKHVSAIYAPECRDTVKELLSRWRETGSVQNEELTIQTANGQKRTVLLNAGAVRDAKGRILYSTSVQTDISDRKNAEEQRDYLQAQLQQAMKMEAIGRLAGGVAHDFNNLLTGILGYAELLISSLEPDSPLLKDLEEIRKAARSAGDLAKQLLVFSRKQLILPSVLNFNDLISAMHNMLARLIGEDIAFQAVPFDGLGCVKVDKGQFEQILVNLAVNARDAMPEGGTLIVETANVELDAAYCESHPYVQVGSYVMLAVSDTGHGMDDEVKHHLFEPFFTTKPKGRGTGLGLATIYGAVKQAGGSIEVYSEIGRGTSFKIYIPRIEEHPDRNEAPRRPASDLSGNGETILLVEDEQIVRELAVKILKRFQYAVISAPDGTQAIETAKKHNGTIHLLITDVVMPGMNGRQLAEELVRAYPGMKVLYASGYTDDAIARHGVIGEDIHFIGKPYSPSDLARKIRELLA